MHPDEGLDIDDEGQVVGTCIAQVIQGDRAASSKETRILLLIDQTRSDAFQLQKALQKQNRSSIAVDPNRPDVVDQILSALREGI